MGGALANPDDMIYDIWYVQAVKSELDTAGRCVSVWNDTSRQLLHGVESVVAARATHWLHHISVRHRHLNRECASRLEQVESAVQDDFTHRVCITREAAVTCEVVERWCLSELLFAIYLWFGLNLKGEKVKVLIVYLRKELSVTRRWVWCKLQTMKGNRGKLQWSNHSPTYVVADWTTAMQYLLTYPKTPLHDYNVLAQNTVARLVACLASREHVTHSENFIGFHYHVASTSNCAYTDLSNAHFMDIVLPYRHCHPNSHCQHTIKALKICLQFLVWIATDVTKIWPVHFLIHCISCLCRCSRLWTLHHQNFTSKSVPAVVL